MKISTQKLPKSLLELTFELEISELKPHLETAAKELSEEKPIQGFRPGKAPYDIVKQKIGEMAILQRAANSIIAKTYFDYIEEQKIDTVDQPSIDIVKLAPENPFIYKATVALLPKIELCDYKKHQVKSLEQVEIKDEEVTKVIDDLRKMRVKEKLVDREAKIGDKVEVNFETFVDQVAIPQGKAEKYTLVLGDKQMIEGFEDQIVGLKKDAEKQFELTFPKKYHSKELAGKKATFKVKLLCVYERELPELNEEFAKTVGLPSMGKLKDQIKHNLEHEKEHQSQHKQDLEILNFIIEKSKFEDLPDSLITSEARKMIEELKDNVAHQGLEFNDYLNHLKKKESDLLLDFAPDAIKRVKTALAIRQISQNEKIEPAKKDIDDEVEKTLKSYQINPYYAGDLKKIEENIKSESSRRYFYNVLTNRLVMEMLRTTMDKSPRKTKNCNHQ